ncbi:MAG: hypothetical protein IK072_03760 [Clostridia bacterium]|nr:hypothetical protein [Clostridia bacterium]
MGDVFFIKIAGLIIKITPLYPLAKELCRDYIKEPSQSPDIEVCISREKLQYELEKAKEPATPEYAEFLCIYRAIAERLPEFGAFVFHGAAISYKNGAYLFTAPSGTGKSTHILLWRRYLGKAVDIINGDKPIIRIKDNKVFVCSTPWAGKEGWQKNRTVPLFSITFLSRSKKPSISKQIPKNCLNRIMNQVYMPKSAQSLGKTLELIDLMLSRVPVYFLGCDISEQSVKVAFEGLTKEEYKKTGD